MLDLLEGCVLDYCDAQFAAGSLGENVAHLGRDGDGFEEVPFEDFLSGSGLYSLSLLLLSFGVVLSRF